MNQSLHSISEQERIISLDIMRGFAILGIFLVNMLTFHSPFPNFDPYEWWSGTADQAIYTFIDIFVQASFYTLFSLLFGYGLVIMWERSKIRGSTFGLIGVRRLSFLLMIGILHALFIWHGDILITYAVMGFLFLLFIRMKGRNLIITGVLLYIIPNLLVSLLLFVSLLVAPAEEITIYDPEQAEMTLQVYQNGSFAEIMIQRMSDWYETNNLENAPFMLISIFPLFLIGGGAAKLKWLEKPKEHKKFLTLLASLSLLIGIIFKLLPYILGKNFATEYVQDIFGGPLLAIGYGVAIALAIEKTVFYKILSPLSFVGKLSMSNYLFQSIVSTLIFYNYGLGLYGKVTVVTGTVMVVLIYILQIGVSRFWISRFYYGPVEWLWRSFTYFNWPKWKREN
ncbi:DUF418 domain-containing protein [Cytobacillus solani]|uniref:DUF418 domain-containing protein n=1 Tax=Cytobacillus solani TaxID=1637975 RepID=UPI0006ABE9CB|nr:DUF418 domain-containing protein [Cytobacillus solani]KOP81692.1 hypothetical protein AMS60_03870 [Bacillus sp. FJAT-21945]USK56611.1 DUF418 domain-containing protein [Cytobacillus solani]